MQTEFKILSTLCAVGGVLLPLWTLFGGCATFGLFTGAFGLFALTVLWDYFQTRDASFPLAHSWKKYVLAKKMHFRGLYEWRKFQWISKNVRESQSQVLQMIISLNGNTKYAKEFGLDKVRSREDLVRIHPVSKYPRFARYHEQTLDGEENVSTSQTPCFFGVTSGTTGKPSKIPLVPMQCKMMNEIMPALWIYCLDRIAPGVKKLERRLGLFVNPPRLLQKSPTGIPVGPVSAIILSTDDNYTTPPVGYDIIDEPSARYVHLLFGLIKRDLTQIESTFCSLVYMGFHEMEKSWRDIVNDIRSGTLKKNLDISPEQRETLERHLSANPERASELQNEFEKGFYNIAQRVWPKLETILCVTSGAFTHYAKILREKYTKDIMMFHPLYGATEGMLGINITPRRIDPPVFMLLPYLVFFEFIPLDKIEEENPETVFIEQVEAGQDYEIVLTTCVGLYRYRLGDVVRVVEFYNQCPIVELLYRTGQLLSIKGEKVSEVSLYSAMNETVRELSGKVESIIDFTSCESVFLEYLGQDKGETTRSPYYVIFLELNLKGEDINISNLENDFAKILDDKLTVAHGRYKYQRDKEGLDQLKVFITKPEAFMRLRTFMLENSTAAPSQLKMPRVLRKPELVRFMLAECVCE